MSDSKSNTFVKFALSIVNNKKLQLPFTPKFRIFASVYLKRFKIKIIKHFERTGTHRWLPERR